MAGELSGLRKLETLQSLNGALNECPDTSYTT